MNTLTVNILELDLNIIVFYKQPLVSFNVFGDIINKHLNTHLKSILVGDANINLLSNSNQSRKYIDCTLENGFYILNNISKKYATRVASRTLGNNLTTSQTIIDHVLTNITNFKFDLCINDNPMSDHKEMQIVFGINESIHFETVKETLSITKLDFDKYNNELSVLKNNLDHSNDFNELTSILERCKLNNTRTKTIEREMNPNKPWINEAFLNLIKQRKRYFILLKKSPSNEYLQRRFNYVCDTIKNQKTILRPNYFASVINANMGNPKIIWNNIKHALFNKKNNNDSVYTIKNNFNQIINDKKAISNEFNMYFRDIGKALHDKLVTDYPNSNTRDIAHNSVNSIFLLPTNSNEICKIIDTIKPGNNHNECISANSLKKHKQLISPIIISRLINVCFHTFPVNFLRY